MLILKGVDELQVECAILHRKLTTAWRLVDELEDSRQPHTLFVAPETREAAAREIRVYKESRRASLAAGYPDTLGSTHGLGNPAVWELQAEINTVLIDTIRRIVRAQHKHGVCILPRLRTIAPRATLLANVRELIWEIPNRVTAEAIQRDLAYLVDRAEKLVDGEDRSVLDAACPHCARRSLVIYLESGVIQCEPPREDGRRPRCRCTQALCQCHEDPGYRHTWLRDSRDATGSWSALSNRLSVTRRSKES